MKVACFASQHQYVSRERNSSVPVELVFPKYLDVIRLDSVTMDRMRWIVLKVGANVYKKKQNTIAANAR